MINENTNPLLEYVVPETMTLKEWLSYRKKHKVSAKDYHKQYPKIGWKVVHSNPKQRGKTVNGMGNMSYKEAIKAHAAIMISKAKHAKQILDYFNES